MNANVLSVTRSNIVFSRLEKIGKRSQILLEKKMTTGSLGKAEDSQVAKFVDMLLDAIRCYLVSGSYTA